MATTTSFDSLIADGAAYLNRGKTGADKVAHDQFPRLINMAERGIVHDLKLQGFERTLIAPMVAGQSIYAKPEGFRETISMSVVVGSVRKTLFTRAYEYCRAIWPDESVMSEPTFYGDHGDKNWLIVPTPDQAYGWEVKVYMLPGLLSEDNQSNWLTENAPDALLKRYLKELALFLQRKEDVATFDAEYKATLGALGAQDLKRMMDRAAQRDGA